MGITIKDLENFAAVAGSKTLSEASEKLEMAQPTLSLGIKKLETELGRTLFTRGRQGIKLTPQGKDLLPKATEALRLLGEIKGQSTNLRFRLGCHPSVGIFLLGNFLRAMHREARGINFEIINNLSQDVNRMVANGELDVGVVMNPLPIQGLVTRYIGEDDVHVWEAKDRYQEKLIFNPSLLQSRSIISRWKQPPRETIEVHNLELICSLVGSGAGMGILPSQVVRCQRLRLNVVKGTPSFKDRLAIVCYPELLKSREGKLIFEALRGSFVS